MSNYLALYRKYRPQTFSDVIGQEHITDVLKGEIKSGTVSHAYLFCGSRGTGKTTCAKILARAVNCEHPKDGAPCEECDMCKSSRTSFDILEIDAASHNGVDDIRDIRDNILYPPSELKRRVYIIDEVHMLSQSAFNALLKTLEEPPEHAMFILATTEMNKIPATILSRCKRFDFYRIPPEKIKERLLFVCREEKIEIEDEALMLIARLATGAMRDALSMLELFVMSDHRIGFEEAATRLGVVGHTQTLKLVSAVAENDAASALSAIAESYAASKDMGSLLSELSLMFRDILMIKYTKHPEEFIESSASVMDELRGISEKFSAKKLIYCTKILDDASAKLSRASAQRRAVLEMAMIRLCDPEVSATSEALLARIDRLEEKVANISVGNFTVAEKPKPEKPKEKVKVASDEGAERTIDVKEVKTPAEKVTNFEVKLPFDTSIPDEKPMTAFGELVESVKSKNLMIYSMLSSSSAYLSGDKVIIKAESEAAFNLLALPDSKQQIRESLPKILGYAAEVEVVKIKPKNTSSDDLQKLLDE